MEWLLDCILPSIATLPHGLFAGWLSVSSSVVPSTLVLQLII